MADVYYFSLPAQSSISNYYAEIRIEQTLDEGHNKSRLKLTVWTKYSSGAVFSDPFMFLSGSSGAALFQVNGETIDTIPASSSPYYVYMPSPNVYYQLRKDSQLAEWDVELTHNADGTAQAHIQLEVQLRNDSTHYYYATWDVVVTLAPISVSNAYIGSEIGDPCIYLNGDWRYCYAYIFDGGEWKI